MNEKIYAVYSIFRSTTDLFSESSWPDLFWFSKIGYSSEIIAGKVKSNLKETKGIKIFETGRRDNGYSFGSDSMKIIPRLRNFFDFEELHMALMYMKQEHPDILMAYNNSTLTPLIIVMYRFFMKFHGFKTKIILKLDNDGVKLNKMKGLRKIINYSYYFILSRAFDRIITETTCGEEIFKKIPGMRNKIHFVPNSIDNRFKVVDSKRIKKIITVSRISRVKGIEILIKAFERISKDYPEWSLDIVGAVIDHKYYQELKQLVKELNLSDKITFTGPYNIDQLNEIYSKAFIFCLTSHNESFAISRLEAISMGMHVVSSEAGCATDFLEYGIKIVNAGDIEGTANAISEYILLYGKEKLSNNTIKIPSYSDLAKIISDPNF